MISAFSHCTGFAIAAGKPTILVPHVLQSILFPSVSYFCVCISNKIKLSIKKPQTNTLRPNPQILPINLGLILVFSQAQDLIYAKDYMFDFGQVT